MDKNIIFITNLHLWSLDKGKGGRAFITTVESYINEGWNIWFVSTGGNIPENVRGKMTCYEFYNQKLKDLLQSNYKLIRFGGRILNVILNNRFFYNTTKKIISNNKDKCFVIYAYEVGAVKVAKIISDKYGFPLVTRFQGTILANLDDSVANRVRNIPHFSALRTNADAIIMTNDGTQGLKTMRRLGNKSQNIYFWRNGVKVVTEEELIKREEFRREIGMNNEFVFLMVSRLVPWKRVERALYAMAEVIHEQLNVKLIIVGDGDSRDELENLSSKLNLTQYVKFIGAIQQKEVYKYMIAADGFLSLYDLSNVGNPLMEAMSCGLPIITLNNGDTSEVIHHEENGVLVDCDKLGEVPSYMKKLVNDTKYRKMLSKNAREFALKIFWSWEDRMRAEQEIVNGLLR